MMESEEADEGGVKRDYGGNEDGWMNRQKGHEGERE